MGDVLQVSCTNCDLTETVLTGVQRQRASTLRLPVMPDHHHCSGTRPSRSRKGRAAMREVRRPRRFTDTRRRQERPRAVPRTGCIGRLRSYNVGLWD